MKSSIFKLLKGPGRLLVVLLVSVAFYQCSRYEAVSNSSQSKPNSIESKSTLGGCIQIDEIQDDTDRAVMKDLDDVVAKIATAYINDHNKDIPPYNNNLTLHLVDRTYCQSSVEPMNAKISGKPRKENLEAFYHSIGTFVNDTDGPQTFTSLAYTKKLAKITSTTVSKTWGIALHGSNEAKVAIPFIAEDGVKISLDFTFSRTSTNTKTVMDEDIYTFPSQKLIVPPKHTYELVAVIDRQHMESKAFLEFPIKFNSIFFAKTPDNLGFGFFNNKEDLLKNIRKYDPDAANDYPHFVTNDKKELVYRNMANIEATYGINYRVELKDISNRRAPILLKTISIK